MKHHSTTRKLQTYKKAYQEAKQILRANVCKIEANGNIYRTTVPSKDFYVHQWKWDSETVAMGLIHFDQELAFDELRTLIAGQWENGMIGHITYNRNERKYYPQEDIWHTKRFSRNGIITSGITQPPILAITVSYIYQKIHDKKTAHTFLSTFLPAILKYHDYLKRYRDPENSGLLTIIHPWESGTDNSPRWDIIQKNIHVSEIPQHVKDNVHRNRTDHKFGKPSQRPQYENYYRFLGLIHSYAQMNWNYERIVKESPFAMKDILFTSIWVQANECLASLLESDNQPGKAKTYRNWARQSRHALSCTWDSENKQFCDIDVTQGRYKPVCVPTIAMFLPLYARAVTQRQLPVVLSRLFNPEEFWTYYPIPSTSVNSPLFESSRYWRGPTWPIINFFVYEGLMLYKDDDQLIEPMARILLEKSLDVIMQKGWYEYFSPHKDNVDNSGGFGFGKFSWTAALFIRFYNELEKLEKSADNKKSPTLPPEDNLFSDMKHLHIQMNNS